MEPEYFKYVIAINCKNSKRMLDPRNCPTFTYMHLLVWVFLEVKMDLKKNIHTNSVAFQLQIYISKQNSFLMLAGLVYQKS